MTVVCLGEVLLRLSMPGVARFRQALPGSIDVRFTGAEANVAAGLASLGQASRFVTALPKTEIADACLDYLRCCRMDVSHVVRTDVGRVGTFYFEHGVNQRAGNIVYDRDHSSVALTPPDAYDWDAIFADADWFFVSGITAAISRHGRDLAITSMQEARRRNLTVGFDINHRARLWKWHPDLSPEQLARREYALLVGQCDVLFCGRSDAVRFFGVPSDVSERKAAEVLAERQPNLKYVAGSIRSHQDGRRTYAGYLLQCEDQNYCESPTFSIDSIVDRLGIGDAFAAGLIQSMQTNPSDWRVAVKHAAAMGCLAHTIEGDFPLVTADELDALLANNDSAGAINR